jgi:hypothetical protein
MPIEGTRHYDSLPFAKEIKGWVLDVFGDREIISLLFEERNNNKVLSSLVNSIWIKNNFLKYNLYYA